MTDKRDDPNDLTVQELEQLLEVKRRAEMFRKASGKDEERPSTADQPDDEPAAPRSRRYQSLHLRPEAGKRPTSLMASAAPERVYRSASLERIARERGLDADGGAPRRPGRRTGRSLANRLLLIVEIAAVIGLVAVVVGSALQMRTLNQEAAEALSAPTAVPTIVSVLPGGSAPPTPAPLPGIYERLVRRTTPIVVPTPSVHAPVRVVIERIGVDAPIVYGDDWEALKKGVGHHPGSANPGTRGNMVLSGHDDVFGEVFRFLPKLEEGDLVVVHSQDRAFEYTVVGKRVVEPTEVSVMAPTNEPTLTLITCYPYRVDTHRMVVFAELDP
jgi:sortase A